MNVYSLPYVNYDNTFFVERVGLQRTNFFNTFDEGFVDLVVYAVGEEMLKDPDLVSRIGSDINRLFFQDYESRFFVQALIKEEHVGQFLIADKSVRYFLWMIANGETKVVSGDGFKKLIKKTDIGRWLTMVVPEVGHPYIAFSTRGKL